MAPSALAAWEDALVEFCARHWRERPTRMCAGLLAAGAALRALSDAHFSRHPSHADLVSAGDAEPHVNDNPYIAGAHRRPRLGWRSTLASTCRVHNETANIWSHGGAALYLLYLAARERRWQRAAPAPPPPGARRVSFVLMLLAFAGVTGASTAAHTLNHKSRALSERLFAVDRTGISVMLATLTLCAGQIHFEGAAARRAFSAAVAATGALTARTVFQGLPSGQQAALFGAQTVLGLIPLAREFLLARPADAANVRQLLLDAGTVYGLAGAGAVFFGLRLPERLAPGRFDLVPGHALMHIFTAWSMICAYSGSKRWASWKEGVVV